MTEAAVAVIQPAAIRHNLQRIRAATPGCRVMAVIKANGYGHGLVTAAKILHDVDALAVARVSEGLRLREAGIEQRIVVLEGCSNAEEAEAAVAGKLDIVVHDPAHFSLLEDLSSTASLDVWLKLDTGMGRLGFPCDAFADCMRRLNGIASGVHLGRGRAK